MKKQYFIIKVFIALWATLAIAVAYAEKPLWTFTPLTPTQKEVLNTGTETIIYTVTNQSTKKHQLVLKPQRGISQAAPCFLGPKNSANSTCTLTLKLTGNKLPIDGISKGPILCQAYPDGKTPNSNQCYQPSQKDSLKITVFYLKSNGSSCTNGLECQTNACIPATHTCNFCTQNNECAPGNICTSQGFCITPNGGACATDAGCIIGSICSSGKCLAPNGAICSSDSACQSSQCISGKCRGRGNGASCSTNATCQSNFCSSGVCTPLSTDQPCSSNAQCQSGYCSPQGTCAIPNTGASCTSNAFCQSNICSGNTCLAPGSCAADSDCPNSEHCDMTTHICVAVCVPRTCVNQGVHCGSIGDVCGGILNCGVCPVGQICSAGVCGPSACIPETCAQLGAQCGIQTDGCGGLLDCGTCTAPQSCGGGGVASQCG
ncbi:hypothetical protein [Legionella longbeachae]|uniref:hypothetical protein n=1 Tax=Legionella longbeachae TaxID=450 RepID=UPI0012451BCF|nr:hypothetical protein [Legionella longbeachae]QEY51058.1 hypothetical protein FQU71_07225 [Legionella longbeachae]